MLGQLPVQAAEQAHQVQGHGQQLGAAEHQQRPGPVMLEQVGAAHIPPAAAEQPTNGAASRLSERVMATTTVKQAMPSGSISRK